MKRFFLLAFLVIFGSAHAEGIPDIADASQEALSPADELAMGADALRQIRSEPSYLDAPELVEYLDKLGARLVAQSYTPNQRLQFFVLHDNTVNAFALPGGFIGVHTGLLLTTESESELAAVLAHEISHVTQHHLARMIAESKKSNIASLAALAVAILAARTSSQASSAALATAQANSIQSQLKFTREHEQEADRIGLQILQKAGFDVHAMPAFFLRLEKSTRLLENNAPDYMRTHPITSERIADIEGRIQNAPYRQVPDSPDYLLLKEKLLAEQGYAPDALAYFESSLKEKKYANEAAHRFGLVTALMRNHQYSRAEKELASVRKTFPHNAIVETMEGKILLALGKPALDHYRHSLDAFPDHRALVYDYSRALIDEGKSQDAVKFLDDQLSRHADDDHLFSLEARAYAALGKNMLQHQAQAEAYLLLGNPGAAIEQLQIALKSNDGDFYTRSSVESRLKELKGMMEAAGAGKKKR